MSIEETFEEDHLVDSRTNLAAERATEFGRQFRRIAVPENVSMSCFEQIDEVGNALGRVWVSRSVQVDPVEK